MFKLKDIFNRYAHSAVPSIEACRLGGLEAKCLRARKLRGKQAKGLRSKKLRVKLFGSFLEIL